MCPFKLLWFLHGLGRCKGRVVSAKHRIKRLKQDVIPTKPLTSVIAIGSSQRRMQIPFLGQEKYRFLTQCVPDTLLVAGIDDIFVVWSLTLPCAMGPKLHTDCQTLPSLFCQRLSRHPDRWDIRPTVNQIIFIPTNPRSRWSIGKTKWHDIPLRVTKAGFSFTDPSNSACQYPEAKSIVEHHFASLSGPRDLSIRGIW